MAWEFERLMAGPPCRILIVDDSEDVREMYAFYIRAVGYHVEVASDGAAGVQLAERGSFDVIVMDFAMPKMDGREATRRLKADERARHIPIRRRLHLGEPDRRIARDLGISRNTVAQAP